MHLQIILPFFRGEQKDAEGGGGGIRCRGMHFEREIGC